MTTEHSTADSPLLKGRYRLGELIGTGGLAGVYRAHDEFLGRDVAVKVFRATASAESDFQRQKDEVNVLARLNHPNLVTLLDAAVDRADPENPRIYYVMELVEGTDLEQRLAEGSLTARQVAQMGYYVAAGLEQVHHLGIVHRDIKPSNIMLATYLDDDSRITAKLTDFGLASAGSAYPVLEDGTFTGTVAYLSPEQASGDTVTPASDIYSLGLVLLRCFTGEVAFPGSAHDATLARQLEDPPVPASVPQDWVPLLRGMTERVPEDRPPVHEVALALREMFTSELGRHRLEPTVADAAAAAPPSADTFDHITAIAASVLDAPVAILTVDGRSWVTWRLDDAPANPSDLLDPVASAMAGFGFRASVPLGQAPQDSAGEGSEVADGDEGSEVADVAVGEDRGQLCVLDIEEREASLSELATLADLASIVMREVGSPTA